MKDEIHFHDYLNAIRINKKVSLKDLSYGLCSISMMGYITTGERLPNYRLRNRLMSRLGVMSEGYEEYVYYDEYLQWQNFQLLIESIEDKNLNDAKSLLCELKKEISDGQNIAKQFLYELEAKCWMLENRDPIDIFFKLKSAVSLTMPNIQLDKIDGIYVSIIEIYFILEMLEYEFIAYGEAVESNILNLYQKLIKKITSGYFAKQDVMKVLPKAVVDYGRIFEENERSMYKEVKTWFSISDEVIELSRECKRTYYLVELLALRKKLSNKYKISLDKYEEEQWLGCFENLYKKQDIKYSGYIYREIQILPITEVISTRRIALGFSQEELCSGICSVRTLQRIEKGKTNPQFFVLNNLFRKLGIDSEFRRNELYTYDESVLDLLLKFKARLNCKDFDDAEKILLKIELAVDNELVNNCQTIERLKLNLKYAKREISANEYTVNLKNVLQMTFPYSNSIEELPYLTFTEINIIYNICLIEKDIKLMRMLYKKSEENTNKLVGDELIYDLVMTCAASEFGNMKEYEVSNNISRNIIDAVNKKYRCHLLHKNLYNVAWNEKKNGFDEEALDIVEKCLLISDFCKEKNNSIFYANHLSDNSW